MVSKAWIQMISPNSCMVPETALLMCWSVGPSVQTETSQQLLWQMDLHVYSL